MAKRIKTAFLDALATRYGSPRKLGRSDSLYEVGEGAVRIYIRYSRVHGNHKTWYGLRAEDLRLLEGRPAIICFLWDDQPEPLCVPYAEYEDVFQSVSPAGDGQYKAQILLQDDGTELYIARAGRFNVESHFGWDSVSTLMNSVHGEPMPELTHPQMQTLLGAIGTAKGYDVWIPYTDRPKLDWSLTNHFHCCDVLPYGFEAVQDILQEIDVLWVQRGSGELRALYEVEHSTPVYSGLLRFNDIHLVVPGLRPRFSVVANDARRSVFVRQLNRPTFRMSGLSDLCTFLEYANVYGWHKHICTRSEKT